MRKSASNLKLGVGRHSPSHTSARGPMLERIPKKVRMKRAEAFPPVAESTSV